MISVLRRRFGSSSLWRLRRTLGKSVEASSREQVVLHGHLGLGDQIASALAVEAWSAQVPWIVIPSKPKHADQVATLFAYLPNVEVVALSTDDPRQELEQVRTLARSRKAGLVSAGWSTYAWACRAFPELGINSQLLAAALILRRDARSQRLRQHVLSLAQIEGPPEPYVFVDHHPGTEREIPANVYAASGLRVVHNPRDQPLMALAALIDGARELHLVSSAPLCLALSADLGAGTRVRYRSGAFAPLKLDYPVSWTEYSLEGGSIKVVDRVREAYEYAPLTSTDLEARHAFRAAMNHLEGTK